MTKGLELHSRITSKSELELSLVEVQLPAPGPDEVVVKVQAAPINPSDLGLLLGPAEPDTGKAIGLVTTLAVPEQRLPMVAARIDQGMKVGNEGAGVVVEAGASCQDLLGKTVAIGSGGMYATHRLANKRELVPLPAGVTAEQGAAAFVNPMTALCFLETMRAEGHSAIVHTAAASNLGQMLVKLCAKDGVPLVNIVRSPAQAKLLRDLGAELVIDSTSEDFRGQLTAAVRQTRATLAFDAIGGGTMGSQILHAMEVALVEGKPYNRYGSPTFKQVYIYGTLDPSPTVLNRTYGFAWGCSTWLVTYALQKLGAETAMRVRTRIMAELTTTFASKYTATISLREAIQPDVIVRYAKKATGEKYLIDPSK